MENNLRIYLMVLSEPENIFKSSIAIKLHCLWFQYSHLTIIIIAELPRGYLLRVYISIALKLSFSRSDWAETYDKRSSTQIAVRIENTKVPIVGWLVNLTTDKFLRDKYPRRYQDFMCCQIIIERQSRLSFWVVMSLPQLICAIKQTQKAFDDRIFGRPSYTWLFLNIADVYFRRFLCLQLIFSLILKFDCFILYSSF